MLDKDSLHIWFLPASHLLSGLGVGWKTPVIRRDTKNCELGKDERSEKAIKKEKGECGKVYEEHTDILPDL